MNSIITPFKIHDENALFSSSNTFTTTKSSKKALGLGGVGGQPGQIIQKKIQFADQTPQKGLQVPLQLKSNRKALSSLSTSQVNARTPGKTPGGKGVGVTPGANGNGKNQSLTSSKKPSGLDVQMTKEKKQNVVAFSLLSDETKDLSLPDISMDDMICSRNGVEFEEPYDTVMRKAASLNYSITLVSDLPCEMNESLEYSFHNPLLSEEGFDKMEPEIQNEFVDCVSMDNQFMEF